MFGLFGSRKEIKDYGYALYAASNRQARRPVLYCEKTGNYRVPDTIDGRFDCLALHVSILLDRLERCADKKVASRTGQALFDFFFRDMDQSLRQNGVGDMGVPRHMKRMLSGFNGRHARYRLVFEGLNSDEYNQDTMKVLAATLQRNVYGIIEDSEDDAEIVIREKSYALAQYVRNMRDALNALSEDEFLNTGFAFPDILTKPDAEGQPVESDAAYA